MNIKTLETKWNNSSLRGKMLLILLFPLILILIINIYMYININSMIERIDEIYIGNINLNELSNELSSIQNSMRDYLENKGSTALNSYYIAEQEYRNCMEKIHDSSTMANTAIMERNILNQSEVYLQTVAETIQAKRGRNVEKYKATYEESEILYMDLQNCIFSLNNNQFKNNTENYSVLLSSLKYMEIITIAILIFTGVVNVIIILPIARSITLPLTELSKAANEVAKGNFDIDINPGGSEDEMGIVSKAFNKMVESIQQYITEIKDSMQRESQLKEHELVMESRMREAQLRSLQAQINPHFLFNTLNAGAQLAMMEDAEKTTEFITNMADFFRYNIKKINLDATIEEEVAMVDKYIYILNVRFTGEINYSKQIDIDTSMIRVPSMILQPIVENAINYGIRDIDWEGHIVLHVYKKGEYVYMSIKDNGVGMSQDKIEKILSGEYTPEKEEKKSDSNGIGLGNVIERLQIYTGYKDVIEIISEGEGKGTEFIIKVPMHV